MTSWASVPRTRAPRPAVAPCPGMRSAALAVTGALLAGGAASAVLPMLLAGPAQAQETPAPAMAPVTGETAVAVPVPGRSVSFDYSAEVARNDVYDTDRAQAPLPLFRSLGDRVDVEAEYVGPAARLSLVARLSSSTGWTTTVPLASEVDVQDRGRVRATLDLFRLEERAARVAEQTKMPFEGMAVALVAVVRDDGGTWTPEVALQLSPQQLRLAGGPETLVVTQDAVPGTATAAGPAPVPTVRSRLDGVLGWRPGAELTGLGVVLALVGGAIVTRRREEEDDADRARRALGRLLLEVRPPDLSGLRVVDVASPQDLSRLAERYGLLVLHWTDETGAVFVVQDEATAYRWTVGAVVETPTEPVAVDAVGTAPAPVWDAPTALPTQPAWGPTDEQAEQEARARAAFSREVAERQRQAEQAARREAERRRLVEEAARREAERRRLVEAAEQARLEAAHASAARIEAEQVERRREAEAAAAAQALQDAVAEQAVQAAVAERTRQEAVAEQARHQAAAEQALQQAVAAQDGAATEPLELAAAEEFLGLPPSPVAGVTDARVSVPAPRDGGPTLARAADRPAPGFDLADGPPRQALDPEPPRGPSLWEVG